MNVWGAYYIYPTKPESFGGLPGILKKLKNTLEKTHDLVVNRAHVHTTQANQKKNYMRPATMVFWCQSAISGGSCAYAFTLNKRSDIPFTTISTNLGIIGTGVQSKFK